MHGAQDYLHGLAQLHELESVDERRSLFRHGLAALAAAAANQQPTPLEGLPPKALLESVRAALAARLLDDLGFLSRPLAAAAIFELEAALPPSHEKRTLGRLVLEALHEGDAATFVTLATALALGSPRALCGPPIRARVALSLRLPIGAGINADGLALALISRPELEREWLGNPSLGTLPSRRLASRLVERAAREAARRATYGDDSGVRVFDRPTVRAAWSRLLADRESLVWRHVATARGLLSGVAPMRADEIERDLEPKQSPTEWRRGAASLAASIAHDPARALARCRNILKSDLLKRDRGLPVAMIYGLSRAGEGEQEATEALLGDLVLVGEVDAMEALVDLRREHIGSALGGAAARTALERIRGTATPDDDGLAALMEALIIDLGQGTRWRETGLRAHLDQALLAFAEGQSLEPATHAALAAAEATMAELEQTGEASTDDRLRAFQALRELDLGLLETSTLDDLMVIAGLGTTGGAGGPLETIFDRLTNWILARQAEPLGSAAVPHPTLCMRTLRTLLHLLDVETAGGEAPSDEARERRLRVFRVLLARASLDPPSPLRRTLCAALARASEGLVREGVCELSDILVAVSSWVRAEKDLRVLAEASMVPEVKGVFQSAAEVARALGGGDRSPLEALHATAEALPPGISARVEGLRRALLGMARALESADGARSLGALSEGDTDGTSPLNRLEEAVQYTAELVAGTQRRVALGAARVPAAGQAVRDLGAAVDRTLREMDEDLNAAVATAIEILRAELPGGVAEITAQILARIPALPREASASAAPETTDHTRLPPWLPPNRLLGGFYVLRPIGTGAGGSVFVACRAEERHEENPESFALKVPSYNGSMAHSLSEEQFLQLFREEAGALLTLPQHPNLAGFVTFDARARPKPILVMELVQGVTLERLLDKREMSMPVAFNLLDGVAAGLAAMHAVDIGHLDVKPANIILRMPHVSVATRVATMHALIPAPVLVDFGLSGRKVRPGCASPFYGAPEVWDVEAHHKGADPTAADVYAFACIAYELLVGRTLFAGDSLPALVGAHLSHRGYPPALARLRTHPAATVLADVLAAGLAPGALRRASIELMRVSLASLAPEFEPLPWPLAV